MTYVRVQIKKEYALNSVISVNNKRIQSRAKSKVHSRFRVQNID